MLLSLILQATQAADSLSSTVESIPVASQSSIVTLWDIIQKGGLIMIPIGILFTAAIFIFIERFITVRRASASEGNFMKDIQAEIESGNTENALVLCKKNKLPIARMIEMGIK